MPSTALLRLLFLPLLLLPLLLLITPSLAQAQEEGRLYAVELIVFSRDGGGFEEIWPDQVALRYPDRARRLALREGASAADAAGQDTATPLWTSLPSSELQLRNTAAAIDRQSGMRVLVHERWVQPAQWQGRPAPVAITGGRAVGGGHFELEGYVTLRVSRFLHFQTHLWLSEFTGTATPAAVDGAPPFRLPELPPRHGEHVAPPAPSNPVATWSGDGFDGTPVAAAAPPAPSQVLTLQQQRRIRFGEQHYFDHPRFGVLVQVTDHRPTEPAPPQ